MKQKFKQISLFSGIGGFDIASEWAGWETAAWCEWDSYGQEILKYYWPNAKHFSDIKKSDFKEFKNQIHVVTGGFPCQPYSSAGKRLGKADERHLWPEMCRVINEVKPNWIVGENVRGLLTWNNGIVFDEVCADLENSGYDPIVFMIPAVAVGAPHRRDRVWFVAKRVDYTGSFVVDECNDACNDVFPKIDWNNFPLNSPVVDTSSIPKDYLTISASKWRNGSIKAYGNAIVPHVVFELFKVINKYENAIPNNINWKSWFLNELISSSNWTQKYPVQWSQKVLMNRIYNSLSVNTKNKIQNDNEDSDLFLGTPRANERPRSEKFLQKEQGINRIPTPSEFIKSEAWMQFGLLPTPNAQESHRELMDGKNISKTTGRRFGASVTQLSKAGLLPTPTAMDSSGATANMKSTQVKDGSMHSVTLSMAMRMGLLPTPTSVQRNHPERVEMLKTSGATGIYSRNNGECRPNSILDYISFHGLIPTPTANDMKNSTLPKSQKDRDGGLIKWILNSEASSIPFSIPVEQPSSENISIDKLKENLTDIAIEKKKLATEQVSQLNPEFVGEMMGFPPYWTIIPYIKKEQI